MNPYQGLEASFEEAFQSSAFSALCKSIQDSESIAILGNGGLHYVASHLASDLTRLCPNLRALSFDSFGFITSNANDFGFNTIFTRWLDLTDFHTLPSPLVIGLTCSGTSANIVKSAEWCLDKHVPCHIISGRASSTQAALPNMPPECLLDLNQHHYHKVEILSMMLLYQIVEELGHNCPTF